MEVNPNISAGGVQNQKITTKPAITPASKPAPSDSTSFRQSDAVEEAIETTPDVRSEAVEKARMLLNDTNYPTRSVITSISQLIAQKLSQGSPQG